MREILFRGKRIDNGEWVYGSLHIEIGETDKNSNQKYDYRILGLRGECYYVIPETVGQYIGLTDKNGNKIFEGDIVHAIYKSNYIGVKDIEFGNGVIKFDGSYYSGSCFLMDMISKHGCRVFSASVECEIIGNVQDNPEFLEEIK